MASAGGYLHALRERHGVSLEELAHSTLINRRFLEALEADEFGALPAGPFAKGFIRSYCEALNESPEEPLALYAAAISATVVRRHPPRPPRKRRSLAPVLVSLALLVILGAALAAVTLVLRPGRREGPVARGASAVGQADRPRATEQTSAPAAHPSPPVSESAASRPAASPAPAPGSAIEVPAKPALAAPELRLPSTRAIAAPYRLVARASDPTWIRVRMEGGRTTEETIPAGEVREWISNRPFELRIGNAGGLSLELNGQRLPSLGARGTVIMHLVVPVEAP